MEETKGKDEQGRIILTDGRLVVGGPWLDRSYICQNILGGFRVGICVSKRGLLNTKEVNIDILGVVILDNCGINLPDITVYRKELWTKDLVRAVVREIRKAKTSSSQEEVEHIVRRVSEICEKEKELPLPDGRRLIGGLDFTTGYCWLPDCANLLINGKIKSFSDRTTENATIFTIENLYVSSVGQPPFDHQLYSIENKAIWCRKAELLVIDYLNTLVKFSSRAVAEQLSKIAQDLARESEWSAERRRLDQKLAALSPEVRKDYRLLFAFSLINEICN